MSFLGKVFGKKSGHQKHQTPSAAIQQLRETEDMLYKKQSYLESKIEKEIATARSNAKKNKKVALQALQRKKRYQQQLQQIDGTLSTIEVQREVLEGSATNTTVLSSMKNASNALKANNKFMNVDKLDEMMGDLADQREMTDEISNAISNPVGFTDDIDEDELEKELEELSLDSVKEESKVTIKDKLPSVPQDEIPGTNSKISVPNKTGKINGKLKDLEASAS